MMREQNKSTLIKEKKIKESEERGGEKLTTVMI